ncbi:MAG: hypothetical protein GXP04_13485 [Alphaproteobacteria bacterium]|nr:hypothetical protein [Alphaproteobacteria bacterium]
MLLFFAPTAFAASADVVICLEINGQTSLERAVGEDCANFIDRMPDANILAKPQHCSECTDYMLSNSVFRTKAAPTENNSKTPQKLFVAVQSQNIWPQLNVALSIAATPPPHKTSTTLTHLRTVIIRV